MTIELHNNFVCCRTVIIAFFYWYIGSTKIATLLFFSTFLCYYVLRLAPVTGCNHNSLVHMIQHCIILLLYTTFVKRIIHKLMCSNVMSRTKHLLYYSYTLSVVIFIILHLAILIFVCCIMYI